MMQAPFEMETKLWDSIQKKNRDTLAEYISVETVFIVNGKRIYGSSIFSLLTSLDCVHYSIGSLEVLTADDSTIQTLYSVSILNSTSKLDEGKSLTIATTWINPQSEQITMLSAFIWDRSSYS